MCAAFPQRSVVWLCPVACLQQEGSLCAQHCLNALLCNYAPLPVYSMKVRSVRSIASTPYCRTMTICLFTAGRLAVCAALPQRPVVKLCPVVCLQQEGSLCAQHCLNALLSNYAPLSVYSRKARCVRSIASTPCCLTILCPVACLQQEGSLCAQHCLNALLSNYSPLPVYSRKARCVLSIASTPCCLTMPRCLFTAGRLAVCAALPQRPVV